MKRIIGIDGGLTGALALLDDNGAALAVADMPVMIKGKGEGLVKNQIDPRQLRDVIQAWTDGIDHADIIIAVEHVNSRPTAGPESLCPECKRDTKALGSSSVFSMGDSNGAVRSVVALLDFEIKWVSPVVWKKYFGLAGGHEHKDAAREKAIEFYPVPGLARKKDHNRAEALLIARWTWLRIGRPIAEDVAQRLAVAEAAGQAF